MLSYYFPTDKHYFSTAQRNREAKATRNMRARASVAPDAKAGTWGGGLRVLLADITRCLCQHHGLHREKSLWWRDGGQTAVWPLRIFCTDKRPQHEPGDTMKAPERISRLLTITIPAERVLGSDGVVHIGNVWGIKYTVWNFIYFFILN